MKRLKQVATIRHGHDYFELYENGMIGRKNCGVCPSEQWQVLGAVRFNNFGHEVERMSLAGIFAGRIDSWQHKNGKQRWHVMDLDHGTRRVWQSPNHEIYLLS